mmetsp:Transcript_17190/g.26823  ORF Transcript_17190/g.26823 Transcript_17190/m.26823 type:complete len:498 (+) Transcript_17190:107-1600(+)
MLAIRLPQRYCLTIILASITTVTTTAFLSSHVLFRNRRQRRRQNNDHDKLRTRGVDLDAIKIKQKQLSTKGALGKKSNNHRNQQQSNQAPPLRMTPPRKLCLMVEPSPFTHISGYSNRFNEMLRFLAKAGDEVEIVTASDRSTAPESSNNSNDHGLISEKFGHKVHHTRGFAFPLYNEVILSADVPDMIVGKVIQRMQPDLVHVTSPSFLIGASILYARLMSIPLVVSYHTHMPMYATKYLGWLPGVEALAWYIVRFWHSWADLTLVTSSQMQNELQTNGINKVEVWRKGIDTEKFNPKFKNDAMRYRMSDGNPDDYLLVYIGRLGKEKRLKDLKPILERIPNARLCIVGDGPQKAELERHFSSTGRTHFTGKLLGEDLSKAFASGDVFVMPSDSETLGFVVLESMASGVPVVGARAGGVPDLINDGINSFLVTPGDTDAFVDRLIKLKDVYFRNKVAFEARRETERWSWEAATSVLRNIQYEKAIENFKVRGSLQF